MFRPNLLRTSINRLARDTLQRLLRRAGYKRKPRPYSEFIDFKETLQAAATAGLSVGEYIERRHAKGSRTPLDETMDHLASLGLFNAPMEHVCEIGPGSGRYLERIKARLQPQRYEIYETSSEWRNWLLGQHDVTARACDGRTLSETVSGTVDLVHANKVFVGLPALITISYLREMARIVRNGGWIVFDIMSESCFEPESVDAWFKAHPWDWPWSPQMIARDYVINMFAERGISLEGSFMVPLFPAVAECMVFRRKP
jgi:phospholipid N-methyltransferase